MIGPKNADDLIDHVCQDCQLSRDCNTRMKAGCKVYQNYEIDPDGWFSEWAEGKEDE